MMRQIQLLQPRATLKDPLDSFETDETADECEFLELVADRIEEGGEGSFRGEGGADEVEGCDFGDCNLKFDMSKLNSERTSHAKTHKTGKISPRSCPA
jgi:hypothetical protein